MPLVRPKTSQGWCHCAARICFALSLWCGWFAPKHLWARRHNSKSAVNTKTVANMADKDFPNSGILFRNDRKRSGTTDPDYKGTCDITCDCGKRSTRKLAGWIKAGRSGKFLTLSLKPHTDGGGASQGERRPVDDSDLDRAF